MTRPPRDRRRLALGATIWLGALVAVGAAVGARAEELRGPSAELARYLAAPRRHLELELAPPIRTGDPVLGVDRRYVGRVVAAGPVEGATRPVTVAVDPEVTLPEGATFRTRTAPRDSAAWVLDTLLPEEKREAVTDELEGFLDAHQEEVSRFLRPVGEDVIAHAMTVLEDNLHTALEARDAEIHTLLDRHRGMVEDDVVPVIKERLGPKAKKKAEPILREIGRELWDELPMWSLSWRAVVDTIPGTSQDRVDRWWSEFVDEKAIPILASHEEELLKALEELIEEGARDPEVRKALGEATRRLARDPDFKALVRGILEDALIRPFDAKSLLQELSADPEHRRRFGELEAAFAPTLKRIGRMLTLDPESGRIDPDLARVLRRVVFGKDARWVAVVPREERGS